MVTVDKYIRKLLFEHDCVIIPEFGGLLTHHIGAHYDIANSLFVPARKRLAFNEVLKIDDGLLTYYVAAHERLPREEAASQVRRYVDMLRQQLTDGVHVVIEAIGNFSMNSEGKLVFEPDYSQNYNSDWFGLQPLEVPQIEGRDQVEENLSIFEPLEQDEEFTAIGAPSRTWRNRSWVNWAAAVVFLGTVTLLSTLSSNSSSSLLSTLNPFETVGDFSLESYTSTSTALPKSVAKSPATEPNLKKTDITSPVKASIPPVPLKVETKNPVKKPTLVETIVYVPKSEKYAVVNKPISNTVRADSKEKKPKRAAATVPQSPNVEVANHMYFLIAGSFGSIKNAQILKQQLINKGFSESSILDNAKGRLIKVSAGAFPTMESAIRQKNKVDKVIGAESWVYHRK
ncbi:SPOR domain-containing protein [Salmonirosea aquatica]|uniref:SPOR domain-containing protein n=1 Tax=Salmonirosea aquatica TaxID=2654236 RepID=A0A7C9FRN1_9BACT|nr:hypothetical protein [Cytophagaceae bacterium SJW1-29]